MKIAINTKNRNAGYLEQYCRRMYDDIKSREKNTAKD